METKKYVIKELAEDKTGGVEKIEFYPKRSNPFSSSQGFMNCSKNVY